MRLLELVWVRKWRTRLLLRKAERIGKVLLPVTHFVSGVRVADWGGPRFRFIYHPEDLGTLRRRGFSEGLRLGGEL